jgi:hypothetical protein
MFKALLLATWYDLSDIALSGVARAQATPERTAFVALPAPASRAWARPHPL